LLFLEDPSDSVTGKKKFLLTETIENQLFRQLYDEFSRFFLSCRDTAQWAVYKIGDKSLQAVKKM